MWLDIINAFRQLHGISGFNSLTVLSLSVSILNFLLTHQVKRADCYKCTIYYTIVYAANHKIQ